MTEGPDPTLPPDPPGPDVPAGAEPDPARERRITDHLEASERALRERMIAAGDLPPEARDWPL